MHATSETPKNEQQKPELAQRFVSEIDLEKLTGLSRRTWQKKRLFNQEPRFYRIHGAIRYDINEVLEWIRSNASSR